MISRAAVGLVLATTVACTGTPERPSTARSPAPGSPPAAAPSAPPHDAGAADAEVVVDAALPAAPALPVPAAPARFAPPHTRTASPDDGVWSPIASHEGAALLYQSTVHPSPTKGQAKVVVVAIDLARVALRLVAGTREPVGPPKAQVARPGVVPLDEHAVLLAVTNGGWRSEHGHFGMRVGADTIAPAKSGACTVGLTASGGLTIAPWEEIAPKQSTLAAWRQTPACLAHRGALHPALVRETMTRNWGAAVDGGVEIPRTALGVDATGRYAFFGLGDGTSAKALGDALLAAGALSVAELDINWSYTRFFLFDKPTPDAPVAIVRSIGTKGQHPPRSYLDKSSERDFFYLVRKTAP